jgi:hypothetical protein
MAEKIARQVLPLTLGVSTALDTLSDWIAAVTAPKSSAGGDNARWFAIAA